MALEQWTLRDTMVNAIDQERTVQVVEKAVGEARRHSIQDRAETQEIMAGYGLGLLYWLTSTGDMISPWWSKVRDADLRVFWPRCDHLAGAMYALRAKMTSVPVRVEPRDPTMKAHMRLADDFHRRLVEESEFGKGWVVAFGKWLTDLWSQDNGAFFEVIGPGRPDGPLTGAPVGLAQLDSWRCHRTRSVEYPVVYQDETGAMYKIHSTRVAHYSQMESPIVDMRGVGLCAVSRAVNVAQNLLDIAQYKQEKMGSRPLRAIIAALGIPEGTVGNALALAAQMQDQGQYRRYAKVPIIEGLRVDADLKLVDLASLPDGFDEQTSVTLGMYAIALAFAVPPRWLWPATVTGATKADAMYQHIAGMGGGMGQTLRATEVMLGGSERGLTHMMGKFLPPTLKLVFDFQDDEQDRMRAEIHKTRTETRAKELDAGLTTVRTARLHALADGEIDEAEFEEMELADGRLPDGTSALALFESEDPDMRLLLDLGVPDPTDVMHHDPQQMLAVIAERKPELWGFLINASRVKEQREVRLALGALEALENEYKTATMMTGLLAAQAEQAEGEEQEQPPAGEGEEAPQEGPAGGKAEEETEE